MNRFVLLVALVYCCQAAKFDPRVLLWRQFKDAHNKQYSNEQEEIHRFGVFKTNLEFIDRHNQEAQNGLHSYTLKMNQFGDMTSEEFKKTMLSGLRLPSKLGTRKIFNRKASAPLPNIEIPASVDWRQKGAVTTVIENQGQCGSCWAFTATGALEAQHFLKTGNLVRLSAQNLMDCSGSFGNQGCNGGYMDYSFEYIKSNKGIDTEASYPYEAQDGKCRFNRANVGATDTGYVDLPVGNETSLEIAIAAIGPISVAVDASQSSFQFYSSGVYDEPKCSSKYIDHSFILVGYDTYKNGTVKKDYYIAKNSWGDQWGDHGYIWMSRNKNNQCGIANIPSYPTV